MNLREDLRLTRPDRRRARRERVGSGSGTQAGAASGSSPPHHMQTAGSRTHSWSGAHSGVQELTSTSPLPNPGVPIGSQPAPGTLYPPTADARAPISVTSFDDLLRRRTGMPQNYQPSGNMVSASSPLPGILGTSHPPTADARAPISVTSFDDLLRRRTGMPQNYQPSGNMVSASSPLPGIPVGRGRGQGQGAGRGKKLISHGMRVIMLISTPLFGKIKGNGVDIPSYEGNDHSIPFLQSKSESLTRPNGKALTPCVIFVAPQEDIAQRIMSFSQQGPNIVFVLSAMGPVSIVTLRHRGGSFTYENRYEILSLSGSYPSTNSSGCSLSVSLASSDGRVFGGLVGETLIAADHVQVVVCSVPLDPP